MQIAELFEAAAAGGANYWLNPVTKEVIPASDHGDAVAAAPSHFGISYVTEQAMAAAFPYGSEDDETPDEDDADESDDVTVGPLPEGLWGERSGWHRNDAWEQLAMNHGWVRIGEAIPSISHSYLSAATPEAAWAAVRYLDDRGVAIHPIDIEVSSPALQLFVTLIDKDIVRFIRGGPRRARQFLDK